MANYKFTLSSDIAKILQEKGIYFLERGVSLESRLNKEYIFSENCTVSPKCFFQAGNCVCNMGGFSYTNSPLEIQTIVGNYCTISRQVIKRPTNPPVNRFTTSAVTYMTWYILLKDIKIQRITTIYDPTVKKSFMPFIIEHDVFIGHNCFIYPGITVKTGAIVKPNSLVTHDVPPYAIVEGQPAQIIGYRFNEKTIVSLIKSQWYLYDITALKIDGNTSVDFFLEKFEEAKSKKQLQLIESFNLKNILEKNNILYSRL